MLRKNAKVDLLKRVPLFSRCSKRELQELAALADEVDAAGGPQAHPGGGDAARSSS